MSSAEDNSEPATGANIDRQVPQGTELCVHYTIRCPCPENVASGEKKDAAHCSKHNCKLYSGVFKPVGAEKVMNHLRWSAYHKLTEEEADLYMADLPWEETWIKKQDE